MRTDAQSSLTQPPLVTNVSKKHLFIAWDLFKRHWAAFLLAELAIVFAWIALEIAVVIAHRSGMPAPVGRAVWLCLHVGFLWTFCGLIAVIHAMALEAVDGVAPTFTAASGRFRRAPSYLLASFLYWAAVVIGLCLAVVPGVIVAVRWALFRFVLATKAQSALTSLHESASLSSLQRWRLFRVLALCAVLNLAGAAVLGLGLLIAFPVTVILRASHFRDLQRQVGDAGRRAPVLSAAATVGT